MRSPLRYIPVYILIKERKLQIATGLPSHRRADCIASVPETNPVTEKSVPTCARKKYNLLGTATTILSSATRCPIILVCYSCFKDKESLN